MSPLFKHKFPTAAPLADTVLGGKTLESNSADDFTIVSNLYAKIL